MKIICHNYKSNSNKSKESCLHNKINVYNVVMKVSTSALDLENFAAFSFTLLKAQTRFSELSVTKTTKTHIYKLYTIVKFRKQGWYK